MIYKIEVECVYCGKAHVYPIEIAMPKPRKAKPKPKRKAKKK